MPVGAMQHIEDVQTAVMSLRRGARSWPPASTMPTRLTTTSPVTPTSYRVHADQLVGPALEIKSASPEHRGYGILPT